MKTFMTDLLGKLDSENAPKKKQLSRRVAGLERIVKAYTAYAIGETKTKECVPFSPSAEDVEAFASIQHNIPFIKFPGIEFTNIYRSRFLTQLLVNCKDSRITIAPQYPLTSILAQDSKKPKEISIYGRIGGGACECLKHSTVHLYGNALDLLCANMTGGEVILHGSATQRAGNDLRGGILRIEGSAGKDLGMHARNGTIYAKRAQSFGYNARQRVTFYLQEPSPMANNCKATVYIAGKKTHEKGRPV